MKIKVALTQLNCGPDIAENLKTTEQLIRDAAGQGAEFVATPETTDLMCYPRKKRLTLSESEDNN